jgi:septal ring factor EnvC (AmiA/AmiB activator)
MTTKNTDQLKKVTGMNEIPFVSEGIASATSGYVVNEDGLTALVEASLAAETSAARITELESQLAAANTAKETAENNLATANASLKAANEEVNGLKAKVAELSSEDAKASATAKGKDVFNETEDAMWEYEKSLRAQLD